jgi:ABC-2 type transport system permease protein
VLKFSYSIDMESTGEPNVIPVNDSPPRIRLGERLRGNPVLVKELRGRMRGSRAFVLLTIFLTLLSLGAGLVYVAYRSSQSPVGSLESRQVFGKAMFGVVAGLELLIVSFTAPALTAGSISSEREHQTYDLLRVTLLPARLLVLGKFASGFVYLLLLLFAALPLQSLAFLFGGVAVEEVVIGTLLLVVTAAAFCAVGVFFSSFIQRTLVSTVLAYAFAILLVFGLPMFIGLAAALFNNVLSNLSNPAAQELLIRAAWILVSLNPLATGVAAEAILLDNQSLWALQTSIANGRTITLVSPWIPYTIFYSLLSLLLLWLSVRFVHRIEK